MSEKENLTSIRIVRQKGLTCSRCEAPTGTGPVGFEGDQPLCDLCMLDASAELGLVLMLITFARATARGHKLYPKDTFFLAQLALCARVFDNYFEKEGFEARFPTSQVG